LTQRPPDGAVPCAARLPVHEAREHRAAGAPFLGDDGGHLVVRVQQHGHQRVHPLFGVALKKIRALAR